MDQEIETLNQQMQSEIKQIRDKYNKLKKECRARYKPKVTKKKRSAIPKALKNEVWLIHQFQEYYYPLERQF